LNGNAQLTIIFVPFTVVVGCAGVFGVVAAITPNELEA
jgi:hypothetical protein